MKKTISSTLRIDSELDYRIKILAKQNRISCNKMKIYLLEIGLSTYLKKYDDYFKIENLKLKEEEKNE